MVQVKPAPTEKTSQAAPVRASERIEFVDILRGFALFGVLAANMASFIGQSPNFETFSGTDRIVVILIRFLIQAKFYSLFSLLFGWGMAMQMRRAEAKGARFAPLFLRRLVILLIFGVLHGFFIWRGDILTTYALFGFLLLLFRKRSGKVILAAAVLVLLLSIVLTVPGDVMDGVRTGYENLTAFLRSDTRAMDSYGTGSYVQITQSRIQEFLSGHSYALYYFGNVFAMFLLGLYFGKRRIFQDVDRHLPSLRKVTAIGLAIGVVFNGIFVWTMVSPEKVPDQYTRLIQVGTRTIGAPALMLF